MKQLTEHKLLCSSILKMDEYPLKTIKSLRHPSMSRNNKLVTKVHDLIRNETTLTIHKMDEKVGVFYTCQSTSTKIGNEVCLSQVCSMTAYTGSKKNVSL
jgi:hypothetical protein